MDERMIKLMEEQNALLREMNTKLDDIMRGVALNVVKEAVSLSFTDETKLFLEKYAKQRWGKNENC